MFYLSVYSENKDADQLRGYRAEDLRLCFRICKTLVLIMTRLISDVSHQLAAYTGLYKSRSVRKRVL